MAESEDSEQGRQATRPSQFGWRDWLAVLRRVGGGFGRDHLSILAAGVAFFSMLALFPSMAVLISLYGLVANPADVATHTDYIRPLLPPEAYAIIANQMEALVSVGSSGLGFASIVALLFALWSTRAAVAALIEGLNVVYVQRERRSIVRLVGTSVGLTLLLVLLAIVAIGAIVLVPTVLAFVDLGPVGAWLTALAPWPILFIAVVAAIGVIYRYGPDRAVARKRWVSLGAVVAAVLWVVASLLFSFYVSNFADYNKTYGSLGAIAILLLWFYVGALAVLIGAELNAEMELRTRRDTTTGREKPMGERGAYVADHVS
jgi:membrane protein